MHRRLRITDPLHLLRLSICIFTSSDLMVYPPLGMQLLLKGSCFLRLPWTSYLHF